MKKIRIIFFIGSFCVGGKERRLIELLTYLKNKGGYEMMVILAFDEIAYPKFKELNIDHVILNKKPNNKNIGVFFKLFKICKDFKPDIIHTWGSMQSFYMIPASKLTGAPLINSQITDAPPQLPGNLFLKFTNYCNFKFSSLILANSYAGLIAYKMDKSPKSKVIYNGLNLSRFDHLPDPTMIKRKYKITTPYAVVMTASFSPNKNWDYFFEVAKYVTGKDTSISFIGIGGPNKNNPIYTRMVTLSNGHDKILFPGCITEVEAFVNACDIGLLFSTNGEGISNSILEYMALGKPVIADECGGTTELVQEGVNGFFTTNRTIKDVGNLIIELINNANNINEIGRKGQESIHSTFTLEKMGSEFEKIYRAFA